MDEKEFRLPTPEETDAVLQSEPDELDTFETEEERIIAKRLIGILTPKIHAAAEARKSKELSREVAELVEQNKKMMQDEVDKWRKANEPLSSEELEKLVSQEYLEFKITLRHKREPVEFLIVELPVKIEKKFVNVIRKTLGQSLKDISGLQWSTEMSNLERVNQLIEMVPGAMETMAECTALCLDPFAEKGVDKEWVLDNVTASKMIAILKLQSEANRWRDFFSLVSQAIPS